jgi:broad specificity phosphatase PhoE
VTTIYIVQHGEKQRVAGDPGLTDLGRAQATRTAKWFGAFDISAVYASDLRRARETAAIIAAPWGFDVIVDDRVRERMNWDLGRPIEQFVADWERATNDRDFSPPSGDSSRFAGERFYAAVTEVSAEMSQASVIIASHGGVTCDLLRTLLGDEAVPELARDGIPPCAITTLEVVDGDVEVGEIANTEHL